jgi:hypothetical protein
VEEHVRRRVDEYSCALLKGRSTLTWFDFYANFPPSALFSYIYSRRDESIRFTFGFPVVFLLALQDSRQSIRFTAELERSECVMYQADDWVRQCQASNLPRA